MDLRKVAIALSLGWTCASNQGCEDTAPALGDVQTDAAVVPSSSAQDAAAAGDAASPLRTDAGSAQAGAGNGPFDAAPAAQDAGASGQPVGGDAGPTVTGARDVLLVGNSVSGSVSFLDAHSFQNLGSVNVIPDFDEVMNAINSDLVRLVAYPVVKSQQVIHHFEPSGGDRFVDDVFVSPDGTTLYVSRSNLGDVAAFDLTKPGQPRLWRTFVEGVKADHATISRDGTRLVVSATSAQVADVIDAKSGKILGSFATGTFPHQNDYSADGKHIYNSSIGEVGYGSASYQNNASAGDRLLVQVDASSLQVLHTWRFDFGIRPNVITADESTLYAQLSYLNGVIKYDLVNGKEIAPSEQPLSAFAMQNYAGYDEFPHASAHHGLALSGDGKKLCDCGTVDNYVAIVTTADMQVQKIIDVGLVPYWATTSPDGLTCFVSLSGDNAVAVIDYASASQLKVVPVGKFPQRSRLGKLPESVLRLLAPQG